MCEIIRGALAVKVMVTIFFSPEALICIGAFTDYQEYQVVCVRERIFDKQITMYICHYVI